MGGNTIPLFKVFMGPDTRAVTQVLESGMLTQGPRVEEFEGKLREYFAPNPRVLTVNSGTSALHLAFHLLKKPDPDIGWAGLQPGDEVLTSALTCTATNWPIVSNGLSIKWVDTDREKVVVDMQDLRNKLSPKTKVITFVHWGGLVADLDEIAKIREECFHKFGFRPYVVEDCAHAFGAEWRGKNLGNHGNICVFSLQAIKHLTTGDGGLLILPNDLLYSRGKLLRWFGIDRTVRSKPGSDFRLEADIPEVGFKFHMNDINAAIGLINLPHMDRLLARCRSNAEFYYDALRDIKGVVAVENGKFGVGSYWLFSLRILDARKPALMKFMTDKGVVVSQVHKRNDTHSCMSAFAAPLPNLDHLETELLCIPVGWWVTDDDRQRVVGLIREFMQKWAQTKSSL